MADANTERPKHQTSAKEHVDIIRTLFKVSKSCPHVIFIPDVSIMFKYGDVKFINGQDYRLSRRAHFIFAISKPNSNYY